MDVKQAVSKAKRYLAEVFADEEISDVRLEEVEFDRGDKTWLITLGFLQPDFEMPVERALRRTDLHRPMRQSYKLVKIPENDNEVPSIKTRILGEP